MPLARHSGKMRIWPLVWVASLLLIAAALLLNRQVLVDQLTVWQYQPSPEIARLTERSGMSGRGRFFFYAARPSLDGTQTFNQECASIEQSTNILGCYRDQRIYIYNVTNQQLDGIRETTAAHEMLHVAYERLAPAARDNVNKLLEAEYQKLQSDPGLAKRMTYYEKSEPGEKYNELHSIIGTEASTLSSELEMYFRSYFSDRGKVVTRYQSYAKVFDELASQADALSTQLNTLSATIDKQTATYNDTTETLNRDIGTFNRRASEGDFTSQAQFASERAALTARVDENSASRNRINQLIKQYNQTRTKLQAIASQSEVLNRSIDSRLAPAPQL